MPEAKVRLRHLYLTLIASLVVPLLFVRHDRFGVPQIAAPPIIIPF